MTQAGSEIGDDAPPAKAVTLTVVIPHFNHGKVLPRAVASVVAENAQDCEIVIVDDGSTDEVEPVLRDLESVVPSVRVIRCPENRGAPVALNVGLETARGRYVSFLGADDFLLPGFRRAMVDALARYPEAALVCSEVALLSNGDAVVGIRPLAVPSLSEAYLTPDDVRRQIFRTDNWICNTAAVYRTDVIRAAGGFDPAIGAFCDGYLSRILAFNQGFVFVAGVYGVWSIAASTFSAASILDPEEGERVRAAAEARLSDSIIGRMAPKYPELFTRRLRFSAARMQFVWSGEKADPGQIANVAAVDESDRRLLEKIKCYIGYRRPGRILALSWLAWRLRPFALPTIAFHLLRNRWVLARQRARIQARLCELDALSAKLMKRSSHVH